jgi:hypothetical protein
MKFAKLVFLIAGVIGLIELMPLYFTFDVIGRQDPPAISHPGFYYGFVGVALAWQVAFIVISRDPVRLRPMMIPAPSSKNSFTLSRFLRSTRNHAYTLQISRSASLTCCSVFCF